MKIATKRVYEKFSPVDGFRVLVDRLWPRGITKASARIDLWAKDVAPSEKLRQWFHADKAKHLSEFSQQYQQELRADRKLANLKKELQSKRGAITIVTGVKDVERSHIPVLLKLLRNK